jgi:hypothetical protein
MFCGVIPAEAGIQDLKGWRERHVGSCSRSEANPYDSQN